MDRCAARLLRPRTRRDLRRQSPAWSPSGANYLASTGKNSCRRPAEVVVVDQGGHRDDGAAPATTPMYRRERSRPTALLLVVVRRVELDLAKEVHDLRLAPSLDVLAQSFVHGVLLRPMTAHLPCRRKKLVVDRQAARPRATVVRASGPQPSALSRLPKWMRTTSC
jgi:hypothetical protein